MKILSPALGNRSGTTLNGRGADQSRKTLGSYRDCPGKRGELEPGAFVRGSFDRIVRTEPQVFAADEVIYLCTFNGAFPPTPWLFLST